MFSDFRSLEMEQQVEFLTRELVKMKSYNNTIGESDKADYLIKVIKSFPYFQQNQEYAWTTSIANDVAGRKNVFAFVKGKTGSKKTIVYHAHLDTVGTDDFGALQSISHDSDALQQFFSTYAADKDVQADALSNDWLFGRGALDMQSGIAVHLVNLLYFSEHLEELDGNLLVMFNPDEESQHSGLRSALHELKRLQEELSLDYVAAINDDFISPFFEDDHNRYIYTGVAGKLLPCFYIFGREAHVGESLTAIDPTLIASALNVKITQNLDLTEQLEGEVILPPSCLHLRDDKKNYDVQTILSCKLYFNYFVYEKSPKQILDELIAITKETCKDIEDRQRKTYQQFSRTTGLPSRDFDWKLEVIRLEDFIDYLEKLGLAPQKVIQSILSDPKREDIDDRMLAFQIVEALQNLDPTKKPRVILFYAPPFLPANFLKENSQKGAVILRKVKETLENEIYKGKETFVLKKYFPYLSDGSFLSFNGSEEDMHTLKNNFPAMNQLFPMPLETMKELNIPCLNFGVYGKDGHKRTERVYKPYSFQVLPKLIRNVTKRLLS